MGLDILLFGVGLVLLYLGAEGLVGGASSLALRMGITPLVVGLTVVAFGTSSPELVVCLAAAFEGRDAISIGNIIGSNIANIALILGLSSLIRPLEVRPRAVRREYPLMLGASLLLALLLFWDIGARELSRLEGGVLVVGMVVYLASTYYISLLESPPEHTDEMELEEISPAIEDEPSTLLEVGKIVAGIGGLAAGAYLMIESATAIASALGIPDVIIGVTVVAFGTSLPELATSLLSALRHEADISVGNVIGSNLFNILLVLGLVALISPLEVETHVLRVDIWVMIAASLALAPILWWGDNITRWEGSVMLIAYGGYVVWLFTQAG